MPDAGMLNKFAPDPLNEPENPPVACTLPVTVNDPEIIAETVYGNGETYPDRYGAVKANDAVKAYDEDIAVAAESKLRLDIV